ncbi:MAG: hypothetical protein JXB30_07700 [Anaerolineae bacterium]|nr:hypothetical protein [Anaerolineae bacterium]
MSEYQPIPQPPREDPVTDFPPSAVPARSLTWFWIALIGAVVCLLVTALIVAVSGLGWLAYENMQNNNATATTRTDFTLPPEGWSKTIDEQFVSDQNGWQVDYFEDEYGQVDLAIEEGLYRWRVASVDEEGLLWWAYPTLDHRIGDFYVSVDCRQLEGDVTSTDYGLLFHFVNADNFYQFTVSEDQFMNIELRRKGEWIPVPGWESTQLVDPGDMNNLAVLAEGPYYRFFINGVLAHELDDDRLNGGTIGLVIDIWGENEARFQFDNFQLYEP